MTLKYFQHPLSRAWGTVQYNIAYARDTTLARASSNYPQCQDKKSGYFMAPSPRAPLFRQNLALLCLHPSRHEILHRDDAEYCSGAHRGLPGLRQLLRPHQPGRTRPPREAHAARCQRCDLRPDPRRLGMGPAQLPPHGMCSSSWHSYALGWSTNRSAFAPPQTDTHGWLEGHLDEPNYGADWGDMVSFTARMREKAKELGVDLLLVDTGRSS